MQLEDGPQEPHVQVPPPLRSDSPLWKRTVVEQRRLSPAAVDTRCGEKTTCLREGTMQIYIVLFYLVFTCVFLFIMLVMSVFVFVFLFVFVR